MAESGPLLSVVVAAMMIIQFYPDSGHRVIHRFCE